MLSNRGDALSKSGRYKDAILSFDKALKFKPNYVNAWFNKASIYALQGDVDQSIRNLKKAIALDPSTRTYAKNDSDFDLVRNHQRFKKLLED